MAKAARVPSPPLTQTVKALNWKSGCQNAHKNNHLVSPTEGNLMHGYRPFQGYFYAIAVTETSASVTWSHHILQAFYKSLLQMLTHV